jgi:hypothetical protein
VKCFIILEKFEDTKGVRDLGVDRTVWGKISKLTRNKKMPFGFKTYPMTLDTMNIFCFHVENPAFSKF